MECDASVDREADVSDSGTLVEVKLWCLCLWEYANANAQRGATVSQVGVKSKRAGVPRQMTPTTLSGEVFRGLSELHPQTGSFDDYGGPLSARLASCILEPEVLISPDSFVRV